MTDETKTRCVLIPCSGRETWAVPQNCLAEIITVSSSSENPPEEVTWRELQVPVLDFGRDGSEAWREPRVGTGLVAIFLGLAGEGCEYWGVAVRGRGLTIATLTEAEVADAPDEALEHAAGAFRHGNALYQVPDLDGLQKKLADSQKVA